MSEFDRVMARANASVRPSGENAGAVSPAQAPCTGLVIDLGEPPAAGIKTIERAVCSGRRASAASHCPSGDHDVSAKNGPSASFRSGPPSAGITMTAGVLPAAYRTKAMLRPSGD